MINDACCSPPHPEAGIFTWDIRANRVYADGAVAQLYGLDAGKTKKGLPIEIYIERIVAADRPRIAKAIHEVILTGIPFQEDYRVYGPEGDVVSVMAFGQCFHDEDGTPAFYAGIVHPLRDPLENVFMRLEEQSSSKDGQSRH